MNNPYSSAFFSENISEFDPFPSRNGHFNELGDLLHPVYGVGPDELEKVASAHKATPRIPAVLPEETNIPDSR